MSDGGGGGGGGDKGSSWGGSDWGGGASSYDPGYNYGTSGGGSADTSQPAASPAQDFSTPTDFSTPAPSLGNFDYLSSGGGGAPDTSAASTPDLGSFDLGGMGGTPTATGGTFSPDSAQVDNAGAAGNYGITNLNGLVPAGAAPDSAPSNFFLPTSTADAGSTGGTSTLIDDSGMKPDATLPPGASLTSGSAPGTPAPAFSWDSLNYGGPAGSSGAPNVDALNAAPIGTTPGMPAVAGAPGGLSAAGGGGLGAGGGAAGSDLSSTDPNANNPQWSADGQRYLGDPSASPSATTSNGLPGVGEGKSSGSSSGSSSGGSGSWLDSLGIKNPIGTAIAAGGLGYNMLQSNALSKALQGSTGQSPGANLAAIGAPAMAQGLDVTTTGVNNATQGITNLNNAAATNAATGTDLINKGQGAVAKAQTDLGTLAAPLADASKTLVSGTPGGLAGGAATDLAALAAPPTQTAQTLQTQGTGLTGYVGTGSLPPALQTQLDTQFNDQKVALVSKYASRGMPTDPARNSSLAAELNDLANRKVIAGNTMAAQLASTGNTLTGTGLQATQVAGGLQNNIANIGSTATGQGISAGTAAGTLANASGNLGTSTTGAGVNTGQLAGSELANANSTATSLVNSGISESGLAANTFTTLSKIDQEQADRTQKAIAAMAAALSGQSVSNSVSNVARTV